MLLTDWGDNGHHQPQQVSLPPILLAAQLSWSSQEPTPEELLTAATSLIPNPVSKSDYETLITLGETPSCFSRHLHNSSWLHKILIAPPETYTEIVPHLKSSELQKAQEQLKAFSTSAELELAQQLLLHAAAKGLDLLGNKEPAPIPKDLLDSFRTHWLQRNRPGGLPESIAILQGEKPL